MTSSPLPHREVPTLTPFVASAPNGVATLSPVIVSGRSEVLRIANALESLAGRVDQPCAMNWLGYFLGGAGARWKKPCAILFLKPGADRQQLTSENISAAVVLYRLSFGPLATGVYSTDDWTGLRTVIAPEKDRNAVAAAAGDYLLKRGAQIVLITSRCTHAVESHGDPTLPLPSIKWAEIDRKITKERLVLEPTLEKTLSHFGKRTRSNLFYYRRRLFADAPCEFHEDIYQQFNEADIRALNSRSLNPLPDSECDRRIRATRDLNGGFLMGLSGPDRRLLSILGGWRQGQRTVIHHQMNATGYEKRSLVNVMRGFLLEHEIRTGTKEILFYHGTNHPMHSAFEADTARDLVITRNSAVARVMRRLARQFVPDDHYEAADHFSGSSTFLAAVLASKQVDWKRSLADR